MTGATSIRSFLSEAIIEFRFRNPRVDLDFSTASSSGDCLEAIRDGHADLAWITISDVAEGVEQRPALKLPWVLAMRAGDFYSDRVWVEVPELSGLRLIRLPEDSSSGAVLAKALTDVTLAEDAGTADWESALLLARFGVGHAIVPRLPAWHWTSDGAVHLVPLRGLPPLAVGWAARRWDALPSPARAFADIVNRNCRMAASPMRFEAPVEQPDPGHEAQA